MKGRTILTIAACFICIQQLQSAGMRKIQDHWTTDHGKILEYLAAILNDEETGISESVQDELETLKNNPCNINDIDRISGSILSYIINDYRRFFIESHIRKYGPILSAAELELLPGFGSKTVSILMPYICFRLPEKEEKLTIGNLLEKLSFSEHEILTRVCTEAKFEGNRKIVPDYISSDIYLRGRYSVNAGKNFSAGMTYEKDKGELPFLKGKFPEPEMLSAHIQLSGWKISDRIILENFIAGDFTVNFGFGLTISDKNSFIISGDPASHGKKAAILQPHRSTEEIRFRRGAGATIKTGNYSLTAFISVKRRDASIEGNRYTSLPETGLHNTASTLSKRKQLPEYTAGARLYLEKSALEAGISIVGYSFGKQCGIKQTYYNRYLLYDGIWGNAGLDINARIGKCRIFGEIAADPTPSVSLMAGCAFSNDPENEISVIYRGYGIKYKAPYSSSAQHGGDENANNEQGISLSGRHDISGNSRLCLSASYSFRPYPVFGKRYSSDKIKFNTKYTLDSKVISFSTGCSITASPMQIKSEEIVARCTAAIYNKETLIGPVSRLTLRAGMSGTTGQKTGAGFFAGMEIQLKNGKGNTEATCGFTFFDARTWEGRLYCYERNLLYSFSNRILYGKGARTYAMLKTTILKCADIWLRYAFEIKENLACSHDMRLQARIRF